MQARSCVTEYSLLLCLLFERSFQANKALPWPSVCTSQFQGVFRVLRRAWLVSWTGVPQSSSLCRLHHLRLQVHHVTPSILVCCVGPVVLFLATLAYSLWNSFAVFCWSSVYFVSEMDILSSMFTCISSSTACSSFRLARLRVSARRVSYWPSFLK